MFSESVACMNLGLILCGPVVLRFACRQNDWFMCFLEEDRRAGRGRLKV